MFSKKYIPNSLSKKDKKKQLEQLKKSKKLYKKGKYHTRNKISSFKSKKSRHVIKAMKIYKVEKIGVTNELAKASGCSKKGLDVIIKKGMGAYYSSGSRPNQTAHSWGVARLASAITGGKSAKIDKNELRKYCKPRSKALKYLNKLLSKTRKS